MRFGEGGRYEIRERIGRGAMADVYKAIDTQLGNRLYALKVLSGSIAPENEPVVRMMFLEEAKALARIRDVNVVTVFSNGRLPDKNETPYMLMEFLDGRDLSVALKKERQLSVSHAVDIQLAVCAGVHACHLAGVIHRDLKPANIFLENTPKGEEPKVLDFSVAKVPVGHDQTRTDFVVGTESYMAPEQASGKPADERSDQYSLGALLYRCLTGKLPKGFLAKPREIRPEIPEELEVVLLQAMAANPDSRFLSVHDYGRHLVPFASDAGRAKWLQYYTTPVINLRPAFTGPVGLDEAPQTAAAAVTARVLPYDFRVHDLTTNVVDATPAPPASAPPIDLSQRAAESAVSDSLAFAPKAGASKRLYLVAALVAVVLVGAGLMVRLAGGPRDSSARVPANPSIEQKAPAVVDSNPRSPSLPVAIVDASSPVAPPEAPSIAGAGAPQDDSSPRAKRKRPKASASAIPLLR